MMVATKEITMAFRSISDDDGAKEEDIVGAGSIPEPDVASEKKFGGDEDPLDSDALSLEDEAVKELGDDDDEDGVGEM